MSDGRARPAWSTSWSWSRSLAWVRRSGNVSVNTFVQAYSATSIHTTHSGATSQVPGRMYDEMPHKHRKYLAA